MALPYPEVLQAVKRASDRAATHVHEEMALGLFGLATIASVAPLAGVLGTVSGIFFDTIRGMEGEKTAVMAAMANSLSIAIWPIALGIFVGLVSLWAYRYLAAKMVDFDREMAEASNDLVNQLRMRRLKFEPLLANGCIAEDSNPSFPSPTELKRSQRLRRGSMLLTSAVVAAVWAWSVLFYAGQESLPINNAMIAASFYVVFRFGVSCFAAHAVWIRLLDRRPGGMPFLGALIFLGWCLPELVFSVRFLDL
jgi:hypothetical protein